MIVVTVIHNRHDLNALQLRCFRRFTEISRFEVIESVRCDGPSTSHGRSLNKLVASLPRDDNVLIIDQDCMPCAPVNPETLLDGYDLASPSRRGTGALERLEYPSAILCAMTPQCLLECPSWEPIATPGGYADTGSQVGQWIDRTRLRWRRLETVYGDDGFGRIDGHWIHMGESSHNWSGRTPKQIDDRNRAFKEHIEYILGNQ
jgi:hypothetical protein